MRASDIKKTFTDSLAGFPAFSIALDKSTDLSDTAHLAIFIRGVDEEFAVTEELLALRLIQGATTGKDLGSTFEQYGLQWCKLFGVCTDGAPSVVGSEKVLSEF